MAESRPYARIYYQDLKRDYPEVWFDPTALSTFVRLLTEAEIAYPAEPELPRSIRRADLSILTACGLIQVVNGHGVYRVKGHAKERAERLERAGRGAAKRWGKAPPEVPPADA